MIFNNIGIILFSGIFTYRLGAVPLEISLAMLALTL
jgi:hypothetical protein